MGLDMYLTGKKFLWSQPGKGQEVSMRVQVAELFPNIEAQPKGVDFEVGYWRKANAVHQWFVDNVQEGTDDCGEYYVSEAQLNILKLDCEKALGGDESVLDPQSGFFFGSTERDEWYEQDMKDTLVIISRAIAFLEKHGSIYYQSSW